MSTVYKIAALPGRRFELVPGSCRECVFRQEWANVLTKEERILGCGNTEITCLGKGEVRFKEVGFDPKEKP